MRKQKKVVVKGEKQRVNYTVTNALPPPTLLTNSASLAFKENQAGLFVISLSLAILTI